MQRRSPFRRPALRALALAGVLVLAACGSDDDPSLEATGGGGGDGVPPAAGACLEGATDCEDDMSQLPPGPPDAPADSTGGDSGGDAPVSHEPGDDVAGDEGPKTVEPRPGTRDPREHAAMELNRTDDPNVVEAIFWGGVEPCFVFDHAEVVETPEQVEITLIAGTDPEAPEDVACIELAVQYRTLITLDAPVGDRAIVDGADQ